VAAFLRSHGLRSLAVEGFGLRRYHSGRRRHADHNWPAFAPESVIVPSALNPADFSTITRADGTKQLTFKGYPLYYFVKDKVRGDVTGQGVGEVWYMVDPLNFAPKKSS